MALAGLQQSRWRSVASPGTASKVSGGSQAGAQPVRQLRGQEENTAQGCPESKDPWHSGILSPAVLSKGWKGHTVHAGRSPSKLTLNCLVKLFLIFSWEKIFYGKQPPDWGRLTSCNTLLQLCSGFQHLGHVLIDALSFIKDSITLAVPSSPLQNIVYLSIISTFPAIWSGGTIMHLSFKFIKLQVTTSPSIGLILDLKHGSNNVFKM